MNQKKNRFIKRSFSQTPPCHTGPVEVTKNLFCGSRAEAVLMAAEDIRVGTLACLYELDAKIWDVGFRGEILYYPTKDFGVLPDDVLDDLVAKIIDRLDHGVKVGISCMGGHGRTGYVAAAVLGKRGFDDPIEYLREHYCTESVESVNQVRHIASFLGKPELTEKHAGKNEFYSYWDDYSLSPVYSKVQAKVRTCGSCGYRQSQICCLYRSYVDEDETACTEFIDTEELWLK